MGFCAPVNTYLCDMRFTEYRISERLKNNIASMGFTRPTDIQYKCIGPILKREDVLAIAQTGTGKTAAFAIPVIQNLLKLNRKPDENTCHCVVLAPTHELAEQLERVFTSLLEGLNLSTLCLHGGVSQDGQIESLKSGVDIIIATPGRLFDLRSQGHLVLNHVRILVLDEADHMLDLGFIQDIKDLLRHLPQKRQTLFFSATINQRIKRLAYDIVRNPIRIQVSPKNPVSKNVTHHVVRVEMDDKRFFLERVYNDYPESKILCFVRTKVRAERVLKAMGRVDISAYSIHSDKTDSERKDALQAFSSKKVRLLIATDVTARGIDIPGVDIVINYDLPENPEQYIHRIGRTGRGKNKGSALSFCSKDEQDLLDEIELLLGYEIPEQVIDKSTYEETIDLSAANPYDWNSLIEEDLKPKDKRKKK